MYRRKCEIQVRLAQRWWQRCLLPSRVLVVSSLMSLAGTMAAAAGSIPLLVMICIAALVLGAAAGSRKFAYLWFALPIIFYFNLVLRIPGSSDELGLTGSFVSFTGKVIECKTQSNKASANKTPTDKIMVCPSGQQYRGVYFMVEARQTLLVSSTPIQPGDTVLIQGRLELPRSARQPGQFDYRQYLRYKGAAYICRAVFIHVVQRGYFYTLLQAFADARSKLAAMQEKLMGKPEAQLLLSIVLGDRAADVEPQIEDQFRAVGLSHVLAASGFNLSIMVLAARWTMGLVIKKRLWLNLLSLPWIAVYDLMSGLSPSVLRATLMILLALAAGCIYRKTHGVAVLAMCALISLLLYPGCLQDIGFQLSYLATLGIVFGAEELQQAVYGKIKRLAFGRWLSEAASVVLLAQAWVLPVQLNCFHQFNLLFLPANLLVDPLLAPLTVLGFISCLTALVVSYSTGSAELLSRQLLLLCVVLDQICRIMLQIILSTVKYLAGCSNTFGFCTEQPPALLILIYFTGLILLIAGLRKHASRC